MKTWNEILEEERLREASRRFRKQKRGPVREWAFAAFLVAVLAAFVFAVLWAGSGRGQLF